jgi:hypothetical protein
MKSKKLLLSMGKRQGREGEEKESQNKKDRKALVYSGTFLELCKFFPFFSGS